LGDVGLDSEGHDLTDLQSEGSGRADVELTRVGEEGVLGELDDVGLDCLREVGIGGIEATRFEGLAGQEQGVERDEQEKL